MAGDRPQAKGDSTSGAARAPAGMGARLDTPLPAQVTCAPFPVAGIGASAGGLEPLEAIVGRLAPADMALVVMQHLAPSRESVLTRLLAGRTSMPVVTLEDGVPVQPGRVYVSPAGAEVALEGSVFRVRRHDDRAAADAPPAVWAFPRNPIDGLLRSLAEARGRLAIGVVLSGSGSDGTLGLRAVKDAGGTTFVQDPATAVYRDMPESAVEAGVADFSLPPHEIADELARIAAHPSVAASAEPRPLDPASVERVLSLLHAPSGVDFARCDPLTMRRRMALRRIDGAADYARLVERDEAERTALLGDLLAGATSFFRDVAAFEAIRTIVLPRFLEDARDDAPFRAWVACGPTGEEAYSLAMCVAEHLGERRIGRKAKVFCTDVDEGAIARARRGVYPAAIAEAVSPERLARFFTPCDEGYRVRRELRDLIVFARHDLTRDPPFSRLHLVICRNVLPYMVPALQRKVLRSFHYALAPEGFLLLGAAESAGAAADLFSAVDQRSELYTKRRTSSSAQGTLARERAPDPWPRARSGPSIQELADHCVMERYGQPGVVVNERMDVVQIRGKTGPYLDPQPGTATLGLFRLARPDLLVELREAVLRARDERVPVTTEPVWIRDVLGRRAVVVDAVPLRDGDGPLRGVLVLFRTAPEAVAPEPAPGPGSPDDPRVAALSAQLARAQKLLQSTVEALERTEDALSSSHEEALSSSEELRSANQELETSKREVRSALQELGTVNEELHRRTAQLAAANDDLEDLFSHVAAPVVFVDGDLRIRRFSAAAERALALIPLDVGRPVAHLATVLPGADVEGIVSAALHARRREEVQVRSRDGAAYTMRVVPTRTAEDAVRGAVIQLDPPTPEPGRGV